MSHLADPDFNHPGLFVGHFVGQEEDGDGFKAEA
jgi:hypothetical protein